MGSTRNLKKSRKKRKAVAVGKKTIRAANNC